MGKPGHKGERDPIGFGHRSSGASQALTVLLRVSVSPGELDQLSTRINGPKGEDDLDDPRLLTQRADRLAG